MYTNCGWEVERGGCEGKEGRGWRREEWVGKWREEDVRVRRGGGGGGRSGWGSGEGRM